MEAYFSERSLFLFDWVSAMSNSNLGDHAWGEKKASQGVGVSLNEEYSSKEVEDGLNS